MRILIVVDRPKSAIDILAQDTKAHNPHLDIAVTPLHPKRPSEEQQGRFRILASCADVIHYAYWRSADKARELEPWVREKPSILVHHNPYDVDKRDWTREYAAIVVKNQTQKAALPYAWVVPHCVDLDIFTFEEEREDEPPTVGMVAGRIEDSKGILEVAQACNDLGYRFLLVGRLPGAYYHRVAEAAGDNFAFWHDVSVQELVEGYHRMRVVVVNSKDGFESGPLPVLEGMACGRPVLTRPVGMVPDIYNGENMVLRKGDRSDVEDLKAHLQPLMEDRGMRDKLRLAGFWTVKNRSTRHAAKMFSQLYHRVVSDKPLVSVIVPTYNRADSLPTVLSAIEAQTYPNLEVVVCDDGSTDGTRQAVDQQRAIMLTPVKYVNTGKTDDSYGLAKARNLGIVESDGRYVVFLDDRLAMDPDAVEAFVGALEKKPGTWVWGVKDDAPKGFVENFSAIERNAIVTCGMFNERIEWYGAMSQDVRIRYKALGCQFHRVNEARAYSIRGTSRWHDRKENVVKSKFLMFKLYGV